MSNAWSTFKEGLNPAWGRHRTVPPMDAGLRPNLRLDEAAELLAGGAAMPDDVVVTADGGVLFSNAAGLYRLDGTDTVLVADVGSPITAIALSDGGVVAAVLGRGLVLISPTGSIRDLCTDAIVTSCVTALAVESDRSILATVGSQQVGVNGWSRALVTDDRSGVIVRVADSRADVVAQGLAWPSGIAVTPTGAVVVSVSLDHRIELREAGELNRVGATLADNMPIYPGRIAVDGHGYWVAAPYVRNRVTELLLDEPEVLAEMTASISPSEWFVPRLRVEDPFTDTMQMGQLRVLGEVKSWAPARSCGLVFRMDQSGRITESAHARVDSRRHGVTGVAARDGRVVAAAQGYGNLLELADVTA